MASRLLFPLIVLITWFGVVCENDIKIEAMKEDYKKNKLDMKLVRANIIFGEAAISPEPKEKTDARSNYVCSKINTAVKLRLEVDLSYEWSLNLNIFVDSSRFEVKEDNKATLEGRLKNDNCFLYGTWSPSEAGTVELYLNFLTTVSSISGAEVFFLNTVIKSKELSSELMIQKKPELNESHQDTVQAREFSNSRSPKTRSNNDGWFIIMRGKKLSDDEMTCLGSQLCSVKEGFEILLEFGTSSISTKGDGELRMAFLAEKSKIEQAEKAAADFKTEGISPTISSVLVNAQCSQIGIKYTLPNDQKRLRLLTESKILI